MSAVPHRLPVADNETRIAAAYNQAGYRYGKYADGSGDKLFDFEGRYAFADGKTWKLIDSKLQLLRARGLDRLRVLDLGCGPGTWLRRVVVRARQLGFTEIEAVGIDIADSQLSRARALSKTLAELAGVRISFQHGDLRKALPGVANDLCLCLYGVLNHIPVVEVPALMRRIADCNEGYFIATVRAIGSTPTVYVDDLSAALRFYQDNQIDRLDVEFANGSRTSFQSHLYSRAELLKLSATAFDVEDVQGLDLFHLRFATDPRWNPPSAGPLVRLAQELERLEERYCRDPGFMDHAAHLLLVARNRKEKSRWTRS